MVQIKNILLISIFALFIIQPAQGQNFLKKLSDRALKSVEKTDDNSKEKEETASKGFNLKNIMKGMGLSGEPVPTAETYKFDHLIQMHLENFNKRGKKTDENEFITHFNSNSTSMAYQAISGDTDSEQGLFIIDAENGATIILTEDNGEKTGIVYGMGAYMQTLGEEYDEEDLDMEETPETYLANPDVKKTGRTKTIIGFKCEEFVYNDEYTKSNFWITKDMNLNSKDFLSTLFKTSIASHGMGWGYMMESTSVDKETGEKSVMKVTRVDTNSNVKFSLSDYKITNLGSFQPTEEEEEEEEE